MVLASKLPLVVLRIRTEVCPVCAGESGQNDAARRRHLLQAPATPLQLPLTGIGEPPPGRACALRSVRCLTHHACLHGLLCSYLMCFCKCAWPSMPVRVSAFGLCCCG